MSDPEHVQNFLNISAGLCENESRIEEIERMIRDLNLVELESLANHGRLCDLFKVLLTTTNPKIMSSTEDILTKLLIPLRCSSALSLYYNEFENCLRHPNPQVKTFGLNEMREIIKMDKEISSTVPISLCIALIECINSKDTKIGTMGVDVLHGFLKLANNAMQIIASHDIQNHIRNSLTKDDIVRCRIYDLFVRLTKISINLIQPLEFVFKEMCDSLQSTDLIIQYNAMEFMADMGSTENGFNCIATSNIFNVMMSWLDKSQIQLVDSIGYRPVINFYARCGARDPERLKMLSDHLLNYMIGNVINNRIPEIDASFDALTVISQTTRGMKYLCEKYNREMVDVFKTVHRELKDYPHDLKVHILKCIHMIFANNETVTDADVSGYLESWFHAMMNIEDQPNLNFLFPHYVNIPFTDLKQASLHIMLSFASYPWGHQALNKTAGLIEYLLNRHNEDDYTAANIKYEILEKLSHVENVFDNRIQTEIRAYVRVGRHAPRISTAEDMDIEEDVTSETRITG